MNTSAGKGGILFWTWQDEHIENYDILKREADDIAAKGFLGAMIQLRGCRYDLLDEKVMKATARGCSLLRSRNLQAWVCFDHRLAAKKIVAETGSAAEYLIIHGQGDAFFKQPSVYLENEVLVVNGKFDFRLNYDPARNYHMLSEVAITFTPAALERVFAYRKNESGHIITGSLQDITAHSSLFVNNSSYLYTDAFGRWDPPDNGKWYAMVFIRFSTEYPDMADPAFRKYFCKQLEVLHSYTKEVDGISWDEPGYCTSYESDKSRFPVSKTLSALFKKKFGYDLSDYLYALLRDTDSGIHVKVRDNYYNILMDSVFGAQKQLKNKMKRLFGKNCVMGIHHTWHQNASDLINGSMDWWRGSEALSGGFADVGGAERLYSQFDSINVFGTTVLAKSIAAFHESQTAYNNLWGVDFGYSNSPYPADVMDYWVDLMGVHSVKWIPHIYGPTGYFEFGDISWGPGYPNHPTWNKFTELNKTIDSVEKLTQLIPPVADIAVVFPINTYSRIGNKAAIAVSDEQFLLMYKLTKANYQYDVISPGLFAEADLKNGKLSIRKRKYSALIYPFANVLSEKEWGIIKDMCKDGFPFVLYGPPPEFLTDGTCILDEFNELAGCKGKSLYNYEQVYGFSVEGNSFYLQPMTEWDSPSWNDTIVTAGAFRYLPFPFGQVEDFEKLIRLLQFPQSVTAPEDCIATVRETKDTYIFTACPSGYRKEYSGTISYKDVSVQAGPARHISVIVAAKDGTVLKKYIR